MTYRNTQDRFRCRRAWRCAIACAAALLLTTPSMSKGQEAEAQDVVQLAAPYAVRANGLSIQPPVGSSLRVVGTDASAQTIITPDDHSWRMELSLLEVTTADASPHEVMSSVITTLARSPRVLDRKESLLIKGRPAEQAYVAGVRIGEAEARAGVCVVQAAPTRFAVLKMVTLPAEFDRTRRLFERVAETIDYADPADAEQQRQRLVRRGEELLESRSAELLESLEPSEEWFRLFQTDEDGTERELGYVRLQIGPGQRGDVSGKDPARYRSSEKQAGATVRLAARYLPPEGGVNDVIAIYFLSLDRETEDWKVTSTYRPEQGPAGSVTIIGARQGNRCTATMSQNGTNFQPRKLAVPAKGYLSQVELHLLPHLLPKGEQPYEAGFWYFYEKDIIFRRDVIEPAESAANLWRWTAEISAQSGPVETMLSETGEVRSKHTAEGVHWETTTLQRLLDLWRRKGLPIE